MHKAQIESDLQAEGPPEEEFNEGIAGRIPRKRVASGALIRDTEGRVLFVVPSYKPHLDIPGGIVEANESPLTACIREVREELGIQLTAPSLLEVDWIPEHGVWADALMFIFDGGVLDADQAAEVRAIDTELSDVAFLAIDEAAPRLRPSMHRRLASAMRALTVGPTYAEFGRAAGLVSES